MVPLRLQVVSLQLLSNRVQLQAAIEAATVTIEEITRTSLIKLLEPLIFELLFI